MSRLDVCRVVSLVPEILSRSPLLQANIHFHKMLAEQKKTSAVNVGCVRKEMRTCQRAIMPANNEAQSRGALHQFMCLINL